MVRDQVGDVLVDGGRRTASTRPTSPPVGPLPRLAQVLLDRQLDGVVELVPAAGEELDAVVGHRVVRGRQHHAEVGAERRR